MAGGSCPQLSADPERGAKPHANPVGPMAFSHAPGSFSPLFQGDCKAFGVREHLKTGGRPWEKVFTNLGRGL